MKFFNQIWDLEVQMVPVICALLLCEIPGIIQYLRRLYYVPIYFSLFPLRVLNRDLSTYLGDDWFYGVGANLTDDELESLRKKILQISIISLVGSVVIIPAFAGFFSAFFMRPSDFTGFCMLFIAYKLIGLTRAAIGFKEHAISNRKTMTWFWMVYLVYFGCTLTVFEASYEWASPFVMNGDWVGLWKAVRGVVFLKITVWGFILALVSTAAASAFTERKLRHQKSKAHE